MNYRHDYHAGNFADVFKHLVLLGLIQQMLRKDAALFVLDTHAGSGLYDLSGSAALATGEATEGIARLRALRPQQQLVEQYLSLVDADGEHCYAGSPLLLARCLRAQDRLALCETQPEVLKTLRRHMQDFAQVHLHLRDGYAAVNALLPPQERRALVLIDPPYEAQTAEFAQVLRCVCNGQRRLPNAVFAIWYPIKQRAEIDRFHRDVLGACEGTIWIAEIEREPSTNLSGLHGCGMLLIKPPWQFEQALTPALHAVMPALAPGPHARCELRALREL